MKTNFIMLMLAASLATAAHASKFVLPDSCGSEKIDFDVDAKKDQPAPGAPEEGKAQIVFIESLEKSGVIGTPTNRYGMDGAWVGANKGNSYFAISVTPGEHHLCSNWAKNVGMTIIKAEAGKVYYVEAKIALHYSSGPMVMGGGAPGQAPPMVVGGGHSDRSYLFGVVDEDEGKYRIKASTLSISKPKQ